MNTRRERGRGTVVLPVRTATQSEPGSFGPAKRRLAACVPRARSPVRAGSFVEEVLRIAHDLRPAVVVMRTRARTGIGELCDPPGAVRRAADPVVLSVHLPTREAALDLTGRAGINRHQEWR